MTPSELLSYLKSQKWFFGVRADASLLFYSSKQEGVRRHVKTIHGIDFAETLLAPLNGQPVRVINVEQAKAFHEVSLAKVKEDPSILVEHIKENDKLWVRIGRECEALDKAVKSEDETASVEAYRQVSASYAETGAQFIIIFSLGLKLTELNAVRGTLYGDALALHDHWRNHVALKEELMGECWYDFFVFIAERRRLKTSALDLMRYLSLPEVYSWLEGENVDVDEVVSRRIRQSFVYLDLRQERRVIDDPGLIAQVEAQFASPEPEPTATDSTIKGQPAYVGKGLIKGEVVVVKSKEDLASKADLIPGKILVAIQTTPHYIPYLKDVKAIITDEGGITCHAAILSREMKIPCIVGTKRATSVLKDGDEVETDVEKGIIKIIK
ncbi:MAG: PEP-utilizing enzyme [Patescibacteria group bacterium]|nr:PEP-utilizing enzyme [Patescibacteria group bacterium]